MSITYIVLLSVFGALAYLIVWILVINHLSRVSYAKACEDTYNFIFSPNSPMGLITYLVGKQGAGKTTMGAGLTNMTALYMKNIASKTIEKTISTYPKISWDKIDDVIQFDWDKGKSNWYEILKDVETIDDHNLKAFLSQKLIETFLFPQEPKTILQDYIEAKMALIRDNYAYFKGSEMIVRFNYKWAMNMDDELIKLTNNYYRGDYHLQKFVSIFEDEKTITARNKNGNYSSANGGSYLFSQFIRHLGNVGGKIRYYTTTQRAGRVSIYERELSMTTIKIQGHRELFNFDFGGLLINSVMPYLMTLQKFLGDIRERLFSSIALYDYKKYDLACSNKRKKNSEMLAKKYLNKAIIANDKRSKSYYLKGFINKLNNYLAYVYSNGFLIYSTTIYTDIDSNGNYSGDGKSRNFVFPLSWCYGSVNSYCYRWIDKVLAEKAFEANYNQNYKDNGDIPDFKDIDKSEIENLFYVKPKKGKNNHN